MNLQQLLRQENYNLKNEISDLKNAFDLNRDILKVLAGQQHEKNHRLFMQIIDKLTSLNNQAMLEAMELLQEKNALRTEVNSEQSQNYKLQAEIAKVRSEPVTDTTITDAHVSQPLSALHVQLHQQVQTLQQKALIQHEEIEILKAEVQGWKQRCHLMEAELRGSQRDLLANHAPRRHVQRKMTTSICATQEDRGVSVVNSNPEQERQIRRLKRYIEEIENRLLVMIKAHKVEPTTPSAAQEPQMFKQFQKDQEQIKLLKFALNDMQITRKDGELYMTLTKRFSMHRQNDKKKATSAPKVSDQHNQNSKMIKKKSTINREYSERPINPSY